MKLRLAFPYWQKCWTKRRQRSGHQYTSKTKTKKMAQWQESQNLNAYKNINTYLEHKQKQNEYTISFIILFWLSYGDNTLLFQMAGGGDEEGEGVSRQKNNNQSWGHMSMGSHVHFLGSHVQHFTCIYRRSIKSPVQVRNMWPLALLGGWRRLYIVFCLVGWACVIGQWVFAWATGSVWLAVGFLAV